MGTQKFGDRYNTVVEKIRLGDVTTANSRRVIDLEAKTVDVLRRWRERQTFQEPSV